MKMKCLLLVLMGLSLAGAAHAQTTISQLFAFGGPDGVEPSVLIQASDGNFYGVTGGYGGIYQITASGQVTVLYTFTQNPKTGHYDQGWGPAALVEGSDGFLYGVATNGGPDPSSAGTLFKISKSGTGFQVLQIFCTTCTNGSYPDNLQAGTDGNMYGTTEAGGFISTSVCEDLGCGVVFSVTPPGTFTVLHALNGTTEANYPLGVIQASDGNLYGTTGNSNPGSVFRCNPSTGQFKTLHSFKSGEYPLNRLTQASDGTLYGVSLSTIARTYNLFSSSLSGSVKTVSTLPVPYARGNDVGPLLQATDGNLWGTDIYNITGYLNNLGEVFAVSTKGTVEHQLPLSGTNGANPVAGVIQATNGTLYGTATLQGTLSNGGQGYGTVFTIAGLPPK